MSTPETVLPKEVDKFQPPFSIQYTSVLLVSSFRLSQGDSGLQSLIFNYLAQNFGDQFRTDVIDDAVEPAARRAADILANQRMHRLTANTHDRSTVQILDTVWNEVKAQTRTLKRLLADEPNTLTYVGDDHLSELSKRVITADYRWLDLAGSKTGRSRIPGELATPYHDPFLSQWVYHGLMKGKTGPGQGEYDRMFADMVADFRAKKGYDADYRRHSAELVAFYVQHHPDQPYLPLPEYPHLPAATEL